MIYPFNECIPLILLHAMEIVLLSQFTHFSRLMLQKCAGEVGRFNSCEFIAGIIDGPSLIYCSRRASIVAHFWLNASLSYSRGNSSLQILQIITCFITKMNVTINHPLCKIMFIFSCHWVALIRKCPILTCGCLKDRWIQIWTLCNSIWSDPNSIPFIEMPQTFFKGRGHIWNLTK